MINFGYKDSDDGFKIKPFFILLPQGKSICQKMLKLNGWIFWLTKNYF